MKLQLLGLSNIGLLVKVRICWAAIFIYFFRHYRRWKSLRVKGCAEGLYRGQRRRFRGRCRHGDDHDDEVTILFKFQSKPWNPAAKISRTSTFFPPPLELRDVKFAFECVLLNVENSDIKLLFLKNGPTLASFESVFVFQKHIIIFPTNRYVKKCPSSIRCRYSNLQPLKHESSPITTRPGTDPIKILHCKFYAT